MKISPISSNLYSFGAGSTSQPKNTGSNENPISKKGEKALLAKATFLGGLAVGGRLLFELIDGDFLVDDLASGAEKIVNKQHRNASKNKKILLTLGAMAGLIGIFIGGFALLYTALNAMKINYNGNVNAFKKGKDMDVYIKGNKIEKEIYTKMNDKAKNAPAEDKAKLKEQYMQMQAAKNRVPDFVKNL